jgi:hypothetical protein
MELPKLEAVPVSGTLQPKQTKRRWSGAGVLVLQLLEAHTIGFRGSPRMSVLEATCFITSTIFFRLSSTMRWLHKARPDDSFNRRAVRSTPVPFPSSVRSSEPHPMSRWQNVGV